MFINIGNKAFVNADKVKFIVGADAEKVLMPKRCAASLPSTV